MKERQLAETRMEPPVAYRRFRIDVAGLGEVFYCLLLATDLVGKLKRNGLPAGKDAAVRNPIQLFAFELTPVPYDVLEPPKGIDHQRLDCGAGLRSGRLKAIGSGLEGGGLYLLKLDADLREQVGEIRILEQHADRTDQGGVLGNNVVRRHRRHVAAGCGQAI